MDVKTNYIATFNYHDTNGYVDPDTVPCIVRMRNCIFQGARPPIGIGEKTTLLASNCLFFMTGKEDGIQVERSLHETTSFQASSSSSPRAANS